MIKQHIEKLLCKNKLVILKGYISGYLEKFVSPVLNPTTLNNFESNPIILKDLINVKDAYIIISKDNLIKSGNKSNNPYYYIQILYNVTDDNVLQIGLGLLTKDEFKFNMTETSSVIGSMTYNCKKDAFYVNRISTPPDQLFIDQGKFRQINVKQFEDETGIKV